MHRRCWHFNRCRHCGGWHARSVGNGDRFVFDGIQSSYRAEGVGELATDVGDLGDWHECGHCKEREQWQESGIQLAAGDERGAGYDHCETAKSRCDFERDRLHGEVAIEGQSQGAHPTDEVHKRVTTALRMFEGHNLGEALDRIHSKGVQFPQRLAGARPGAVQPVAHQERTDHDNRKKRQERRGHTPGKHQ